MGQLYHISHSSYSKSENEMTVVTSDSGAKNEMEIQTGHEWGKPIVCILFVNNLWLFSASQGHKTAASNIVLK